MTASGIAADWLNSQRRRYGEYTASSLRADASAALTNAAIVLPQGVAFSVIAGLPPQYGLYTAMIPTVIAAVFGSSTIMVTGPATAISAMLFAALDGMAAPGSPDYIQLAILLTVMTGAFQLAAGAARLGALIAFISHSVIVGFTAAAAVLIAVSQIAPALGIAAEQGGGVFERLQEVFAQSGGVQPLAALLAILSFATIVVCRVIDTRIPGYLAALAIGTGAGYVLNAPKAGIAMFAPLPSLLPEPTLPATDWNTLSQLAPGAITIAFVGLLEAISIGRAFAIRRDEKYSPNQEIAGQGLANFCGGFLQCYASSGSFTRSALNLESGAQSPVSAILAAPFLLLLLACFAPMIAYIPVPVMAGIILYVAWRLVDWVEIGHIFEGSRGETIILTATFAAGVVVDLEFSIVVGVFCSLFIFLRKSAAPFVAVLAPSVQSGVRTFRGARRFSLDQCPQIAVLRVEGPVFFASIEALERQVESIEADFGERPAMVLYLRGVGTLDLAGADYLLKVARRLERRGGQLHVIVSHEEMAETLRRSHVIDKIGISNVHMGKTSAISACVEAADKSKCENCTARVFFECGSLESGLQRNSDGPAKVPQERIS